MMEWKKLLSPARIGTPEQEREFSTERSPFQQDFDRIVFSGAFRRLQDKTQVFPLVKTDYVRTRLTHSLEASSIGRSLGTACGSFIAQNFDIGTLHPSDVGAVVATAALAHDIGNPPLGHAGEEAIRHWFINSEAGRFYQRTLSREQISDIEFYEGNAQGFRVITRREMPDRTGGMRLTAATLGAFAKYPTASPLSGRPAGISGKKFSFFQTEKNTFTQVAETCGLIQVGEWAWKRHPLAYLVEAADDIAYLIVDFEDGHRLGLVGYQELEENFLAIINSPRAEEYVKKLESPVRKAEFLRAKAIGVLITKVTEAFIAHHDELIEGKFDMSLTDCLDCADILQKIRKRSASGIYNHRSVAEVVGAGFEMVSGLLDVFVPCVDELAREYKGGPSASYRSKRLAAMLPFYTVESDNKFWLDETYLRLISILDFISGMTDSYAVSLHQKLKGISL